MGYHPWLGQSVEVRVGHYGGLMGSIHGSVVQYCAGQLENSISQQMNVQQMQVQQYTNRIEGNYLNSQKSEQKSVTKKEDTVMGHFREYFAKHREVLMTLLMFMLVDHFLFDGAFKHRIQEMVDGFLNRAKKKLEADDTTK